MIRERSHDDERYPAGPRRHDERYCWECRRCGRAYFSDLAAALHVHWRGRSWPRGHRHGQTEAPS